MIFGQLKKLSNVLMKKINKIEVESNRCLKIRAVTSSCSSCLDICPVNSIEISQDSLEINDSCMECGLCTTVCQTNAIKWNHPPLIQLVNQLKRLSASEDEVYVACASSIKGTVNSNVVEVPCLGMLPAEFWLNAGQMANVNIIYQSEICHSCQISQGQQLFLEKREEAERILNHTFRVCSSVNKVKNDGVDHSRRKLFTSLLEEVKETNTITVKEVLEVEKALSPFEKFDRYHQQQQEMKELVETVEELKQNVIDKLLNDTVIHTDKRALLIRAYEGNTKISSQIMISLPEIKESCSRCGACAFLCPTDAIIMDKKTMILSTNKCISCGLCEEICYEKHIHLSPRNGTVLNEKFQVLLH
jgi:MinD superfamily P-loop ATPase